jgi:hypothetical protein
MVLPCYRTWSANANNEVDTLTGGRMEWMKQDGLTLAKMAGKEGWRIFGDE